MDDIADSFGLSVMDRRRQMFILVDVVSDRISAHLLEGQIGPTSADSSVDVVFRLHNCVHTACTFSFVYICSI